MSLSNMNLGSLSDKDADNLESRGLSRPSKFPEILFRPDMDIEYIMQLLHEHSSVKVVDSEPFTYGDLRNLAISGNLHNFMGNWMFTNIMGLKNVAELVIGAALRKNVEIKNKPEIHYGNRVLEDTVDCVKYSGKVDGEDYKITVELLKEVSGRDPQFGLHDAYVDFMSSLKITERNAVVDPETGQLIVKEGKSTYIRGNQLYIIFLEATDPFYWGHPRYKFSPIDCDLEFGVYMEGPIPRLFDKSNMFVVCMKQVRESPNLGLLFQVVYTLMTGDILSKKTMIFAEGLKELMKDPAKRKILDLVGLLANRK